ncbi:unnamed protein product [Cuscuta epithymum]|uniref:Diacylglycerol O-acyltransferase n=1 Tax=Cuscuta epithymum TaxID=186058 RepID=A0AAV0GDK5_9ASTE|nr:unnamed protein product [Cuscuta epithymum]
MESRVHDEPLTPAGRLFLQPEMDQIVHAIAGVKNPLDVDAVKSAFANSLLLKNPRFCSLLVKDSNGRESWRRTEVNIDDHFVILPDPLGDDPSATDDDALNSYLADLSVSTPLPADKPLWEVHLLLAHKCGFLRIHHSLGDGTTIMSMFLSCCRKTSDPSVPPSAGGVGAGRSRRRWGFKEVVMVVWYTVAYVLEFVLRSLWLKDKKTALSGGAGVELWPRKLATAKFTINDMKTVKNAVAGATINDVLFGVVACGLSRYLAIGSSKEVKDGVRITGMAMVNLRPQPGPQEMTKLMNSDKSGTMWGNKFGFMLLPVHCFHASNDPLQFVKRAKSMIDKKKLSLEAICSYKLGVFLMSFLGVKLMSLFNYRIICNTTFAISNVMGPQEEISIAGNPVTYIRNTPSSCPHAITIHMVSYDGKADLQILVAKDIIPDPDVLARYFEDALMEMKKQATEDQSTSKF